MPARKPKPDEKPQRERFIEAARKAEASDDPEEFERVFKRVVLDPLTKDEHLGEHQSEKR